LSFGTGLLDNLGFWEIGCPECARAHEAQFPEDGECWPHSDETLIAWAKLSSLKKAWDNPERKDLPMQAPDQLLIERGMLVLARPRESRFITPGEYLRDWMQQHNIPNGEPVCVIQRKELQKLFDEITHLRSLIQCA
jgi:hypothetical protein